MSNQPQPRIAIVGYGGIFSQSLTPDQFRHNIFTVTDTSRRVPPGRWLLPQSEVLDHGIGLADKVYSDRGYFIEDFRFDPTGLNIANPEQLDPVFHFTLHAGREAWQSAVTSPVDPQRVRVILGAIVLPTDATSAIADAVIGSPLIGQHYRHPHLTKSIDPRNLHPVGLPATMLATALGLGGGGFTLDAACASSLYALKLAVDELIAGSCDAVLAGGVSRPDCLYTQMGFSQLRALSQSGRCSPFDAHGDGLVVGEGAGVFVLKRLEDATSHGDTIHGVITGIGLSNDRKGNVLAPASEGQLRAMKTAYDQAGWAPDSIDLIECHATGTPVGDVVEFNSLRELWQGRESHPGQCVLSAVKSNVGHTLTAANSAGLLKVLLALQEETLPPTANYREERADIPFGNSPFRILQESEPWKRRTNQPRRTAVSGFGFGGINAHLLLEEYVETTASVTVPRQVIEPVAVVAMSARLGDISDTQAVVDHELGVNPHSPTIAGDRWWGLIRDDVAGYFASDIAVSPGEFRIPPRDLEEMLPQQLLMVQVAKRAMQSVRISDDLALRSGVYIGLGLDMNTTNFHVRWASEESLRDTVHPSLNAGRTLGALGSITASRISREFAFGGPSFTVSGQENSGVHALQVAVNALRQQEIDLAIIGAVDLPGDVRVLQTSVTSQAVGEGAIAFVLKRLIDAESAGDTILAIVDDVQVTAESEYLPQEQSSFSGATEGLAHLMRSVSALSRRLQRNPSCYWLHDRADGPRRQTVVTADSGDQKMIVLMREGDGNLPSNFCNPLPASLFVVEADSPETLTQGCHRLLDHLNSDTPLSQLAKTWLQANPADHSKSLACAFVAAERESLLREINRRIQQPAAPSPNTDTAFSVSTMDQPVLAGELAFVYPGSGSHFPGMGRGLGLYWPEIFRRQEAENEYLRSQFAADVFWDQDAIDPKTDPRKIILGQVAFGTAVTDLLSVFGVKPDAVIGYSLGETTSLFATRAWTNRDDMLQRMQSLPLFATELNGPCTAARQTWGLSEAEQVDWLAGVIMAPASTVEPVIRSLEKVYLLIINSPEECVIGGQRELVNSLVNQLGCAFYPLSGVSTVHCDIVNRVTDSYHQLHVLPTNDVPEIRFYGGAFGKSYRPTQELAATAITQAAQSTLDFAALIRQAYADGVRYFVEIGPGASCSRLIGNILGDLPHFAHSAVVANKNEGETVLRLLSRFIACRRSVDLSSVFSQQEYHDTGSKNQPILFRLPVGRSALDLPAMSTPDPQIEMAHRNGDHPPIPQPAPMQQVALPRDDSLLSRFQSAQTAKAEAHAAYLDFSQNMLETMGQLLIQQQQMPAQPPPQPVRSTTPKQLAYTREQCLAFAVGPIQPVLGDAFAEIDQFPTRVRLPDEPLMLVDRIVTISGEPLSLTHGNLVTEHDVLPGLWYLDNDRIPACISIESGQADLFLSGYLGIDLKTRGLAMYRLLDATVTFHSALPRSGDVIRHDIYIDNFFRQGDTYLFRFRFESSVNGQPLMTMRDGCAGFFTNEELSSGKGLVQRNIDSKFATLPEAPEPWQAILPEGSGQFDDRQIMALANGDLSGCFGSPFEQLSLQQPLTIPPGQIKVLQRVTHLDTQGGAYQKGIIRAEQDVDPQAWYLTCHFIDDQVMPGTLMYECCLHALRLFLLRLGWVGEANAMHFEPVPGVAARLKCRGQVIASTQKATYELHVKTLGYRPEPFAIADAYMYADGKAIVEVTDVSLQLSGSNRQMLEAMWQNVDQRQSAVTEQRQAIFERRHILAFAEGKPSEAFGEPYTVFDKDRRLARLPRPPYSFMDRVTELAAEPWQMQAGGYVESEYDIPPDAWYFRSNRQPEIPFAVLLEAALQTCGWMAAYLGSALLSPIDMRFRNLGGKAVQFRPVTSTSGTLTNKVTVTKVSHSGGMIIQNYDFSLWDADGEVYRGDTYFGFFSDQALAQQVGIRDAQLHKPSQAEWQTGRTLAYPQESPFPDRQFRMVDRVALYVPDGGEHGLGFIEGSIDVDPEAWFFKAHFYQDPVWPGSLGLEALWQLLKVVAVDKFGGDDNTRFHTPTLNTTHQWVYRGQVIPSNANVRIQGTVTQVDEANNTLTANGWLVVDGLVIYQMTDFSLSLGGRS